MVFEGVALVGAVSLLIERVVEIMSRAIPGLQNIKIEGLNPEMIISLIISAGVVFALGLDIPAMFFGVEMDYGMGLIISALLFSGGSNIVHDVIDAIKSISR